MGDETGRLLWYDARRRHVTVLHAGLPYPNGVAVSDDGSHVVVAHSGLCELRRCWLCGPSAGKSETFAEVPGYPDNVRRDDSRGGYWVALSREADSDDMAPTVAVRVVAPAAKNGSAAVVAEALAGFSFVTVSEVAERNSTLWVGSVDTPYAGAAGSELGRAMEYVESLESVEVPDSVDALDSVEGLDSEMVLDSVEVPDSVF
uniref:Male fertility protein-like n=1 Tax=Oryza sativa subsp. japonica TaxID=39947 RepID=Q6H4H6_ORYSJ|nr:male fertility protein-like [Oryza sativa Japonica Group]